MKKRTLSELDRLSIGKFRDSKKIPLVLVLDNVRSQHNIGSFFRTADAFRVQSLYLCGITATPPSREIQKTALDSTESVNWSYFPTTIDAIELLKSQNFRICCVEQTDKSQMLNDFTPVFEPGIALVFGNEVNGVSDEVLKIADESIEIPQFGTKHSLNVSISGGIVIWDLVMKFLERDKYFFSKHG